MRTRQKNRVLKIGTLHVHPFLATEGKYNLFLNICQLMKTSNTK